MKPYDPRRVDKIGSFFVNTGLFALLWAIIALPASSVSLLRIDPNKTQVLSEQKYRYGRQPVIERENATVRMDGTEDTLETDINIQ